MPDHGGSGLNGRRITVRETQAALRALDEATDACRECPIGQYATQSVFGEGPVRPVLMFVGEQPGDKEDLAGRPFVGPAGKLFDRAVAQLGWSREKLYVTNAVKHFKYEWRGKRRMHKTPGQREAEACHHWLESELQLVRPRAIVVLGATAARSLLGRPVAVTKLRGQWQEDAAGRRVLVTLHPSALLRGDPAQREAAWNAWISDLSAAASLFAPRRKKDEQKEKKSVRVEPAFAG
ncbi:UdgX family uracil-DNA binding protein [Variovorax atrisoli]|uniref:UdgX family uracil-DNA binding protein n=1 Tax=Variovorax atrisoli TaxID=3394203 RepID=UPI0040400020